VDAMASCGVKETEGLAASSEKVEETPVVDETPVIEEKPAMEETVAIAEAPVVEDELVNMEAPVEADALVAVDEKQLSVPGEEVADKTKEAGQDVQGKAEDVGSIAKAKGEEVTGSTKQAGRAIDAGKAWVAVVCGVEAEAHSGGACAPWEVTREVADSIGKFLADN
jgi:hypothetical protein